MMTIRHMTLFLEVYREQSITRAAEHLHMTQPAVTRAIKEIEAYYGVRLFERINRHLCVTETGKRFYPQALHIVEAFDALERGLRDGDTFGVLRIGASITIGNYFLPALVNRYQRDGDGAALQVTISNGTSLQIALLHNQLDIALLEGGIQEPELHSEAFMQDHLTLVLPNGHPLLSQKEILLMDLPQYPLLLREKGSAGRALIDRVYDMRDCALHPIWESASTQALLRAVECGLGLSLLPEKLVAQAIADGVVSTRAVVDEDFSRNWYLVWHRDKYLTASAKRLIALCHDGFVQ